jgi:hypothetical protein
MEISLLEALISVPGLFWIGVSNKKKLDFFFVLEVLSEDGFRFPAQV